MKLINKLLYIAALLILASCSDDPIGTPSDGIYPEGETIVRASLDFEPFAASEVASRAIAGNTMDSLDDLCILVYNTEGELVEGFPILITKDEHSLEITEVDRVDDDASNGHKAESKTKHATFELKLPYGKYYIYGVANLGEMDGETRQSSLEVLNGEMGEVIKKRSDFLNHRRSWDTQNMLNNCEMLGYFTSPREEKSPYTCGDMNEKTVSITKPLMEIHSWLRRCASKITIDFDGSGLLPGATVYFHRATIHDIPDACALGKLNVVNNENGLTLITNKNNDDYGKLHPDGEDKGCNKLHPEDNGDNYRPVDGLSDEYAITYGTGTEFKAWPNVTNENPRIMDGTTPIDFHHEKAEAFFLYENMQGDNPDDDGKTQKPDKDGSVAGADTDKKDGMPFGSYIEVEGYYSYTSTSHVTEGKIIYRFMLGKDAEKNFDVERNYHYKITLCPRGYGNDVDWHIEYLERSGFEFNDPYYVSYLYNHDSTLRFRYTPPEGATVDSIDAEIVGNNWWPESGSYSTSDMEAQSPYKAGAEDLLDKDSYRTDNKYTSGDLKGRTMYLGNGFLSLRETSKTVLNLDETVNVKVKGNNNSDYWFPVASVGVTEKQVEANKYMNDNYFYGKGKNGADTIDRSRRRYYFNGKFDPTKEGREQYSCEKYPDGSLRFLLPVFTRAKNLVKASSYTGNNLFESAPRMAYVKVTVYLSDKTTESQILRVQQVPRITNPKGIYRGSKNNENFHVVLTEKDSDNGTSFSAVESDGPWMAEVICNENNFINLNGRSTIKGASGTNVQFNVRFNKMNRDDKVRNAVIRVRYHNYSCVHLIFVRQGYDSQPIEDSGTHWHTCNKITETEEADDPRDEGSLFRFGNLSHPIDVYSNIYNTPGVAPGTFGAKSDLRIATGKNTYSATPTSWSDIPYSAAFPSESDIAEMSDFEKLYRTDNIEQGFGVLYADGATETQTNISEVTGWCRHLAKDKDGKELETEADRNKRGMYGVFVYYWNRGNEKDPYNCRSIFLPVGRSGYGHRRNAEDGTLRYSCGQTGPYNSTMRPWFPLFDDIYMRKGAVYWAKNVSAATSVEGEEYTDAAGLDMNFFSFDVNLMQMTNVSTGSWPPTPSTRVWDAAFLRGVGQQDFDKR